MEELAGVSVGEMVPVVVLVIEEQAGNLPQRERSNKVE